jgi:arylsulfatase A-like enzyme
VTLYDSGIRYVDQYIGKIIRKIKQMGIYKEAMIIVVSDHGEHFAEHYPDKFYSYHGKDFFEEFIKVPIIIKYPFQFKSGKKVDHPVSLVDVFPTLLDFYEIEIPAFVQGDSLLKPHTKRKNYVVSEAISEGDFEKKMIRIGDLKYMITMENPSKPERINWETTTERRLYDLKNDPREQRNLYHHLKYRNTCLRFEKKLARIIKNSAQWNFKQQKTDISNETVEQLKALGYL